MGPTPAQLVQAIDTSFASPLSMPRLSPFYVVALVLVGGVAVSLPALDLGMAAALAAAGIFVFVTFIPHVSGWFTASWVIGGGPGFLTAALALVAPLFRRRVRASEPAVIVTRAGEPVLFHLIERCARAVGAALPASCPSRRR